MLQRHVTLLFACVATLSAGTNYAISGFLPQLGVRLHLTSVAQNIVAGAGNAGVYLSGPLVGPLVDRKGPRLVLSLSALALLVGYLGQAVVYDGGYDGIYARVGLTGLAACQFAAGIGGSAALSASLKATSQSFSKSSRGAAMATVLSCFGLSAFFYSSLSHANLARSDDPTYGFLLTLAFGCSISMFLGALFVRPPATPIEPVSGTATPNSRGDYLAVSTSEDLDVPPRRDFALDSDISLRSDVANDALPPRPLSRRSGSTSPLLQDDAKPMRHSAGDLNVSGWDLLQERDFWRLFAYLALCSGVGLMYINNLGTVVTTLASTDEDPKSVARSQAHLVALLSVFNCAGRLLVGFLADAFTHHAPERVRFARIWWLVATASGFAVSQVLAGQAERVEGLGGLALPTAVLGLAYGSLFGNLPVVCLERFGGASFATNNGLLTMSPSLSAPFVNLLFGAIYDSHVSPDEPSSLPAPTLLRRAGSPPPAHLCKLGKECFATAFRATTVISLVALGLAVVLAFTRTFKPLYHQ